MSENYYLKSELMPMLKISRYMWKTIIESYNIPSEFIGAYEYFNIFHFVPHKLGVKYKDFVFVMKIDSEDTFYALSKREEIEMSIKELSKI